MTNQGQHHNRPTNRQVEFLKDLASETGATFVWPGSFAAASEQIKELLRTRDAMRAAPDRERWNVVRSLAEESGDAAAVREHELVGYGSTASWTGHHG